MDSQMESELESGPTEMFIKVNLLMVFSRVMVFFSVKMVNGHMKVNGRMVRWTFKELVGGKMELITKVNGKIV